MSQYWDKIHQRWSNWVGAVSSPPGHGNSHIEKSPVKIRPMFPLSLYRPTLPIAVTGLRGTGKTVLYDSIIGKVDNSYTPSGVSRDIEPHRTFIKTMSSKVRAQAIVMPGQDSDERGRAQESMFGHERYPAGVIHVVSWGYSTVWEPGERRSVLEDLKAKGTQAEISAIHEWNLGEEFSDFSRTCDILENAWQRHSGMWLIIAVAKSDLFWHDINTARDYYIPAGPEPR